MTRSEATMDNHHHHQNEGDSDDSSVPPTAASAFSSSASSGLHSALQQPQGIDVDADSDDDDSHPRGRARKVTSSTSSCESSFRSCKSSVSHQDSSELFLPTQQEHPPPPNDSDDDDTSADEYFYSDEEKPTESYSDFEIPAELEGWKGLPSILLEDIFVMLNPKQRHQASMVCRTWYEIFYSPRVWDTFVLFERTLTKKRFNLYKGYQRELCPRKTQVRNKISRGWVGVGGGGGCGWIGGRWRKRGKTPSC